MLTIMFFLSLANQSFEPSFYFLKDANFARSSETRAWFSGMPISFDPFPKKMRLEALEQVVGHDVVFYISGLPTRDHSLAANVDEKADFFREFFSIKYEHKRVGPTQEEIDYLNGCASMLFFP
jgi:hypothetical protein